MKKIKSYNHFLTEKIKHNHQMDFILDKMLDVPTAQIMELRDELKIMIEEEELNESISSFLSKLKRKFNKWFDDRLFNFLINRKKKFYTELVDELSIFDVSTLDDVVEAFPGLRIESMYLAGGMDEAEDTGAGWRNVLEKEFEQKYPGKKSNIVEPIKIGDLEIVPSYVIDDRFLDMFLENPKKTKKLYDKPMLLNPVRKEVDRNKDDSFEVAVKTMKDPKFDPIKQPEPFRFFQKTFSQSIEPDDEHLLRISDAVFLGMDKTAGAGTYGELELLSLIRKPLFAWLVNSHNDLPGGFKLWNIPHLSKVARTKEDMEQLVKTIKRYT